MPTSTRSRAAVSLGTFGLGLVFGLAFEAMATGLEGAGAPAVVVAAGESAWDRAHGDSWSPRRRRGERVHMSPEELEGTIWFSEQPHRRVTVTINGDVEIKEGKDIYVHFKERIDDIFVIEVRWWNESANINVLEYGVLTLVEGNQYRYIEADHVDPGCGQGEFPGIVGRGTFELLSEDRAELIQIGHLIDGSASGFTTFVEKVDTFPVPPLEQTYPLPCP